MARPLREDVEGAVQHVYARGNDRQQIFFGEADRLRYLDLLAQTVVRARWRCLAYCLMDNHLHLLVETPEATLGVGMQRLQGTYAQTLNRKYGRCGHVFQGRYGSRRIADDKQLWTTVRYIALNPVVAGLVSAAHDWRWSSHAAVLGGDEPRWLDVGRLLSYFSGTGGEPLLRYREVVGWVS
jgi:REP element-mobilizing transposase RayT